MVITFLSDFGLQDDFVGTCHGVIKRIAPDAEAVAVDTGDASGELNVPFGSPAPA